MIAFLSTCSVTMNQVRGMQVESLWKEFRGGAGSSSAMSLDELYVTLSSFLATQDSHKARAECI